MDIKLILKLVLILSIATLTTACSKKEEDSLEGYSIFEGKILSVDEENESILVKSEKGSNFDDLVLNLSEDFSLIDSLDQKAIKTSELKENDQVKVVYKKSTPVAMSNPPIMTADLVILDREEDSIFIDLSKYDKDLVNEEDTLSLNISEDTNIYNLKGEKKDKNNLANNYLLVFYQASTRSIPAQTSPHTIIILD